MPCFDRLATHSLNRAYWEFYPDRVNSQRLLSQHLNDSWEAPCLLLSTYSDITSKFLLSKFYQRQLTEFGIIPNITKPYKDIVMGIHFRSALLPVLLNPQKYLCEAVNKHLRILRKRKIIGVQMRLGGTKANYNEKVFLGPHCITRFVERIEHYIKIRNWNRENVYVFVSTDSSYALKEIKKQLNRNGTNIVYSVKDWKIGHSALGKSSKFGEKQRDSFMNRAILDLLILKESDYLIYSHGSSYGQMAFELQQSYRYPVHAYKFLKSKLKTCSVFHKRTTLGEASYVSKYTKSLSKNKKVVKK